MIKQIKKGDVIIFKNIPCIILDFIYNVDKKRIFSCVLFSNHQYIIEYSFYWGKWFTYICGLDSFTVDGISWKNILKENKQV